MEKRKKFIVPALAVIFIAWLVMWMMEQIAPGLVKLNEITQANLFTMIGNQTGGADKAFSVWDIIYSFSDSGEGSFLTDTVSCLFMLIGGWIGYFLEKINSPLKGTGVAGEAFEDKWVWLVCGQFLAMFLANIFWRHIVGWTGWITTFTPLVSVFPVAILNFGKPNIKKFLTGLIPSIFFPVWGSQMLMNHVMIPLGIPTFAAFGIAMPTCTWIFMEIFKRLPWMMEDPDDPAPAVEADPHADVLGGAGHLVVSRSFADMAELWFWGSSWAGFGYILGAIVSWIFNPNGGLFGLLLPKAIFMIFFVTAVGMIIWGPRYQEQGYAFTFESTLCILALVAYCPKLEVLIPVGIIFAFIAPAALHWMTGKSKFFSRYAACVSVQYFAALTTIIFKFVLAPFVG